MTRAFGVMADPTRSSVAAPADGTDGLAAVVEPAGDLRPVADASPADDAEELVR